MVSYALLEDGQLAVCQVRQHDLPQLALLFAMPYSTYLTYLSLLLLFGKPEKNNPRQQELHTKGYWKQEPCQYSGKKHCLESVATGEPNGSGDRAEAGVFADYLLDDLVKHTKKLRMQAERILQRRKPTFAFPQKIVGNQLG